MMMIEAEVAEDRAEDITGVIQPAETPRVNALPVNNLWASGGRRKKFCD